ncbi:hypothetical protein JCM24511_05921 [Saitozyma sp. JCM 24511]|nr:hypothetical protein JCM24511_05921 [Saitozyma sp. JCM 24511]
MFKSRKSSNDPDISPFTSPPASSQIPPHPQQQGRPGSQQFQNQNQQYQQHPYPNGSAGQGTRNMATMTTTATVAGPMYNAGIPVDRVNTTDSTATGKSEKRRSFFGIGRKDKDKDKEKEKEKGPSPLQQEQGMRMR